MLPRSAVTVGGIVTAGLILGFLSWVLDDDGSTPVRPRHATLVPFPAVPNAYLMENAEDFAHLRPLEDAEMRTPAQATWMRGEDIVFGLQLEGRAWAVPWWVIKNHHVANLVLGERPVLFTFCEACSGAAAFVPVLEGRRHRFRVVGIYNGSHFISDYESESFWLPFVGEAFFGPLRGSRLELLPLQAATWAQWQALHPETLVVDGEHEPRDGHGETWKPGRPGEPPISRRFGRSLVRPPDSRLPANELVIPVAIGGRARAYPLSALERVGGVVNDTLASEEILILHEPGSLLATVFRRTLGDEVLTFEKGDDGAIVDRTYRSTWSHTGEAIAGPLAGRRLAGVPSSIEAWYGWAANHPNGEIFSPPSAGPQ